MGLPMRPPLAYHAGHPHIYLRLFCGLAYASTDCMLYINKAIHTKNGRHIIVHMSWCYITTIGFTANNFELNV